MFITDKIKLVCETVWNWNYFTIFTRICMLSPPWSSSSPTPNAMPPSIPTLNPISLAFTTHRHSHHCHYHGYDYTDIHGHHYPHHHHHASSASSANVPRKSEHEHGGHSISSFSPVTYIFCTSWTEDCVLLDSESQDGL